MNCRRLNPWEIPDILPLAREFHAEAGVGGEFCENAFLGTLANNRHAAIGLFNNELVGVLLGIISPHWMTKEVFATELMWYVVPQWRGVFLATEMVTLFVDWAKAEKATCVCVSHLANNPSPSRLYKRLGFAEADTQFLKFI